MLKLKFITTVVLLLLLSLPASVLALKVGDPFPPLSGTTLDGKEFNFNDLKGAPILLKVGTTWCPTCEQQSKEIEKLRGFMIENKIKLVEIFINEGEGTIRKFLGKHGHQLPDVVLTDRGKIGRALNVYIIPRVILIDKDFRVYRDADPLPSYLLKQELVNMLAGKRY